METDTLERRAARGDERAFTALMTASKAALYRFVRRYVGDDDEAFAAPTVPEILERLRARRLVMHGGAGYVVPGPPGLRRGDA